MLIMLDQTDEGSIVKCGVCQEPLITVGRDERYQGSYEDMLTTLHGHACEARKRRHREWVEASRGFWQERLDEAYQRAVERAQRGESQIPTPQLKTETDKEES